MKMIVGLGNIGPQYEGTRHNTGFIVVEQFAKSHDMTIKTRKMNAKYGSGFVNGEKVMVVEPTTFMNDSGLAVRPLMDYFDIAVKDIIIVHDDMDLPVGKIRIKDKGSPAATTELRASLPASGLKISIGFGLALTILITAIPSSITFWDVSAKISCPSLSRPLTMRLTP